MPPFPLEAVSQQEATEKGRVSHFTVEFNTLKQVFGDSWNNQSMTDKRFI
jgi:hypothetical protein